MFGKKNVVVETATDRKMQELWLEGLEASSTLEERAHKVIERNGVIDLYPEGADKEAAKRDAEEAKRLLLCAIGHYDSVIAEITRLYKEHKGDLVVRSEYRPDRWCSSHDKVEMAYRNYFNRR